jgi:hypothetical protein
MSSTVAIAGGLTDDLGTGLVAVAAMLIGRKPVR